MVGTAIAAIAAIGGLWAQAVTTYWSQQTAKDQLEQSKEDGEKEKSQQAKRITFWFDPPLEGAWGMQPHIANRSPDAVTSVYLVRPAGTDTVAFYLNSLMPCTENVYDLTPDDVNPYPNVVVGPGVLGPSPLLFFVDRSGVSWRRDSTGLTRMPKSGPPEPYRLAFVPDHWLKTKPAKLCGDE